MRNINIKKFYYSMKEKKFKTSFYIGIGNEDILREKEYSICFDVILNDHLRKLIKRYAGWMFYPINLKDYERCYLRIYNYSPYSFDITLEFKEFDIDEDGGILVCGLMSLGVDGKPNKDHLAKLIILNSIKNIDYSIK